MDTVFCYGEPPATLRDKYREGVDLIMRAWQADEPFAFNGKYTQLRYVNPWPRPLQKPYPPVWIPGGGSSVETFRWCIEQDYLYAYLSYYGFASGKRSMDSFWETVADMDGDLNPYRAGFLQFVAVADDDVQAERLYAKHAEYFYNRSLHTYAGFAGIPGYLSTESVRRNMTSQVSSLADVRAASKGDLTWRDIVDRGYLIAGSPESVAQQIDEATDVLRVGHLMVLMQFGDMPKETAFENTARFARDVIPRLRHKWSEWDDRWFPTQTLADMASPGVVGDVRGER
jgi:alkanesulfonate monooxygenase SsuD/methylene tetrahydromethanopterin reductase-like flavin-dependent oxidoreductase (luciferase family)